MTVDGHNLEYMRSITNRSQPKREAELNNGTPTAAVESVTYVPNTTTASSYIAMHIRVPYMPSLLLL